MYGVGLPELIVITLVVALLFGAPILTFFMGYVVGKNRAASGDATAANGPDSSTSTPTPAPAPEPAPAPVDQPATPEEPADE